MVQSFDECDSKITSLYIKQRIIDQYQWIEAEKPSLFEQSHQIFQEQNYLPRTKIFVFKCADQITWKYNQQISEHMSDIFERLKLQVQNAFDQEFFGHDTQLKNLLSQHDSFEKLPDQMTEEQLRTRGEDSFGMEYQSDSEHELPSSENLSELHLKSNDEPSTNHPRKRYAFKDRKPRQYANFQESFSEEEESEENGRTRKTRKIKRKKGETKDSYPTKNFLPAFKGPHLLHLEYTFGEEFVNSFPIVQQIQDKNGISMSDYEALYKEVAFEKAWKEMFATRQLYRDLMLSRSTTEARKIHIKKIPVFQKAFETKVFNRIN